MTEVVRFGAWAASWGDTSRPARQVQRTEDLDYLVSDWELPGLHAVCFPWDHDGMLAESEAVA